MMFTKTVILLIISTITSSSGDVSCIVCIGSTYSGETTLHNNCYDNASNESTIKCKTGSYCQSIFVLVDGLIAIVQRGCTDPYADQDLYTSLMPPGDQCITTFAPENNKESTTCYYGCATDNCNNITTTTLRSCASNCSYSAGRGYCDYMIGKCVCNDGWSGSDCNYANVEANHRNCVQCNGETDTDCPFMTSSTRCPGNTDAYNYCSSTKTTMFDADGNIVHSILSRGCSSTYLHNDECFFTNPADLKFTSYTEYTCISTCDTDGCNTNIPDGRISGNERKSLYCLECEDTYDDGICALGLLPRTRCPSPSTHCKSTMSYYIADKQDVNYRASPQYKFKKIVRECATSSVTAECKSSSIASLTAKMVTCQETCQKDGCNNGWPVRPKCAQCTSTYTEGGYDACLSSPEHPSACEKPYEGFCVIRDYKLKQTEKTVVRSRASSKTYEYESPQGGYRRSVHRGCSYYDIGTKCANLSIGGIDVENCNKTCHSDSCNIGNIYSKRNSSFRPVYNLLMTITTCLIVCLLETTLITS